MSFSARCHTVHDPNALHCSRPLLGMQTFKTTHQKHGRQAGVGLGMQGRPGDAGVGLGMQGRPGDAGQAWGCRAGLGVQGRPGDAG